jgi:hypothetical protein
MIFSDDFFLFRTNYSNRHAVFMTLYDLFCFFFCGCNLIHLPYTFTPRHDRTLNTVCTRTLPLTQNEDLDGM